MQGLIRSRENSNPSFAVTKRAVKSSKKLVISPLKEADRNFDYRDAADPSPPPLPLYSDALGIVPRATQSESEPQKPSVTEQNPAPNPKQTAKDDQPQQSNIEKEALTKLVVELQTKLTESKAELEKLLAEKAELAAQNSHLSTQVGAIQSLHAQQLESLNHRIALLEKEKRELLSEKESAQKEFERALTQAREEHSAELARAKAEFDRTAVSISERLREAQEAHANALENAKKEHSLELSKLREEHTRALETEHKKYAILQREFETLKKEAELKSKSLEKLTEFVEVTKEMLRNLQVEKEALTAQLNTERETIKRLHALAEVSQKDYSDLAAKNERREKEIEILTKDCAALERKLFNTMALAVKLHKACFDGFYVNITIQDLWEQVQAERIPRGEWDAFIESAFSSAQYDRKK